FVRPTPMTQTLVGTPDPTPPVDVAALRRGLDQALASWDQANLGTPVVAFPAALFGELLDELQSNRDRIARLGAAKLASGDES
ncbi:hypothetical protein NL321_28400, partial [Klebsiella pneumoniae]|nr:hypothetical protein [Klebsiella pneumoniae]